MVATGTTWKGQQYLGADAKGRVYVLAPQENKVYPLRAGELQEPRKLVAGPVASPAPVLDAAMDLAGDWVGRYGGDVPVSTAVTTTSPRPVTATAGSGA